MRRFWFLLTFFLVVGLSSVGFAQRGGGRGGMSGGHGFASHGGMRASGARFSSAPRGSIRFSSSFHRLDGDRFRHRGFDFRFASRRYPFYGYPGYYGGYYSPFYSDWWGSNYDSSGDDSAQRQMAYQIEDLSQEVQRLREQQEYGPAPAPTAPPVPRPTAQATAETDLPVVLVFLDKRIQEIRNYAVVNETLMVFDGPRTKKIPLMDLDLAATLKLNDERGVEFQIPN